MNFAEGFVDSSFFITDILHTPVSKVRNKSNRSPAHIFLVEVPF